MVIKNLINYIIYGDSKIIILRIFRIERTQKKSEIRMQKYLYVEH